MTWIKKHENFLFIYLFGYSHTNEVNGEHAQTHKHVRRLDAHTKLLVTQNTYKQLNIVRKFMKMNEKKRKNGLWYDMRKKEQNYICAVMIVCLF